MKTYIKSLLAIATVALLGSSVQAAPKEVVERTIVVNQETEVFQFQYDKNDGKGPQERWWKLVGTGDAGSSEAIFVTPEPMSDKSYRSSTYSTLAEFKFKGLMVGKYTWTTYWTSPYSSDKSKVPSDDPSQPTGSAGYPSGSDTWAGSNKSGYYNEYVITVTDTPVPEGTLSIDSELEKGAKLSGVTFDNLEGKMIDTNKKEVEGTFAWKNGDETLKRGTAGYAATFTPTGTMAPYYDTVDVTIQVTAATPETIEPVFVKATRITFAEGATQSESQYEGFLTEKGCRYAWGKEDSPTTAWTDPSDGSPCNLPKPDDADQLFVKRPAK